MIWYGILLFFVSAVFTLVISIRKKKVIGILISSLILAAIFLVLAAVMYAVEYTM